jgi:hypothetical protein
LPLAGIGVRLATALAFAGVLAFAIVLACGCVAIAPILAPATSLVAGELRQGLSGINAGDTGCVRLHNGGACEKAGHCRACDQSFGRFFHECFPICEDPGFEPGSSQRQGCLLAAIGGAAAFAFARVLAFAAVVAGFAASGSLAGILSLAGMLVSRIQLMDGKAGAGIAGRCCMETRCRACEKASHCRACDHCFRGYFHCYCLSISLG